VMDQELARLVEDYMINGGAAGIMKPLPALHRVVPAQSALKSEWILPYDDVRALLLSSKTFHVRDCMCRVEQELIGRHCEFPVKVCLSFSSTPRAAAPGDVSQEEALALLAYTEEAGLVHTVSNIIDGVGYVCNCCGCCCGILRGITQWGMPDSVAYANYYSVIDAEVCTACGVCAERCHVKAISEQGSVYAVNRERCIGCGLCVSGCTSGAASLVRKPELEIVRPPADFATWEQERLRNRGLG